MSPSIDCLSSLRKTAPANNAQGAAVANLTELKVPRRAENSFCVRQAGWNITLGVETAGL